LSAFEALDSVFLVGGDLAGERGIRGSKSRWVMEVTTRRPVWSSPSRTRWQVMPPSSPE
jgi:hypothetical protein